MPSEETAAADKDTRRKTHERGGRRFPGGGTEKCTFCRSSRPIPADGRTPPPPTARRPSPSLPPPTPAAAAAGLPFLLFLLRAPFPINSSRWQIVVLLISLPSVGGDHHWRSMQLTGPASPPPPFTAGGPRSPNPQVCGRWGTSGACPLLRSKAPTAEPVRRSKLLHPPPARSRCRRRRHPLLPVLRDQQRSGHRHRRGHGRAAAAHPAALRPLAGVGTGLR